MSIEVQCGCGKTLRARDEAAGKRGRCPTCGAVFTVPIPAPVPSVDPIDEAAAEDAMYQLAPAASARRVASPRTARPAPAHAPGGFEPSHADEAVAHSPAYHASPAPSVDPTPRLPVWRSYLYFLLLVAMLPLVWSTFQPRTSSEDRFEQTLKAHPELIPKFIELEEGGSIKEEAIWAILPNQKFEGAFLPHDTKAHWLLAILSAGAFMGLVLCMFPTGHAKVSHLLMTGLFTGTLGILFLLAVQWIALHTQGVWMRGSGIITLLFYIVKFIGFSYRSALDADSNFFFSAMGFTLGVGLCEEICKALPLVFRARQPGGLGTWRTACLWGLMSGVGFGVSEGITYAGDYYNGISGGGIYLVRFISCVALHAIWSASVGITLYRRQGELDGPMGVLEWLLKLSQIVAIPMVLHGLYDTLLKQEHGAAALGVAVISFGWLAWQLEWAKRKLDESELTPAFA